MARCPKCGSPHNLKLGNDSIKCTSCDFVLLREVAGRVLSETELLALLSWKRNMEIDGQLYNVEQSPDGGWNIEVTSELRCPVCGSSIMNHGSFVKCINHEKDNPGSGCNFSIWRRETADRGHVLTQNEIKEMLKGKTCNVSLASPFLKWVIDDLDIRLEPYKLTYIVVIKERLPGEYSRPEPVPFV